MLINNYLDTLLINSMRSKNNSLQSAETDLARLLSLNNFNNIGTVINDIKMDTIESEVRGTSQGNKNIQSGVGLIDSANKSLESIYELTHNIRELATEYTSDTITDTRKAEIEESTRLYLKEMKDILKTTKFNNLNVFEKDEYVIQTGAYAGETFTIDLNGVAKKLTDVLDKIDTNTPIIPPIIDGDIDKPNIEKPDTGGNGSCGGHSNCCCHHHCNTGCGGNEGSGGDGNEGGGGIGPTKPPTDGGDPSEKDLHYVKLFKDGQIVYEGWVDETGKGQSYGEIYDPTTQEILYKGELKDGKPHGEGILYKNTSSVYKGTFENGKKNGIGEEYNDYGGLIYRGEFKNDERSGKGVEFNTSGVFKEGIWGNGALISNEKTDISKSLKPQIDYDFTDKENSNPVHVELNKPKELNIESDKISISSVLNTDFIDKYLLTPVNTAMNSLDTQKEILGSRTRFNDAKIEIYDKQVEYSATNQYLELMKEMKEDKKLLELSSILFNNNLDQRKNTILGLLY